MDPQFIEIVVIEAGQDGHTEDHDGGSYTTCRLSRGTYHFASARGVDGQHAHAKASGFADCAGDSIWNVMVFQIKKDSASGLYQVADDPGAFRRVELHPYLVAGSRVAHG